MFKFREEIRRKFYEIYERIQNDKLLMESYVANIQGIIDRKSNNLQKQVDSLSKRVAELEKAQEKVKEEQEQNEVEVDEYFVMYKQGDQRRYKLTDTTKDMIDQAMVSSGLSVKNFAKTVGIGCSTLYKVLDNGGVQYGVMQRIKAFLQL